MNKSIKLIGLGLVVSAMVTGCSSTNAHNKKVEEKPKTEQIVLKANNDTTWDITSSSTLENNTTKYGPKNVFDDSTHTVWSEGVDGEGGGEWITFKSKQPVTINSIYMTTGLGSSQIDYENNGRVKTVRVEFSGGEHITLNLKDERNKEQKFDLGKDIKTEGIRFIILDSYKGKKYDDTCIGSISFNEPIIKQRDDIPKAEITDTENPKQKEEPKDENGDVDIRGVKADPYYNEDGSDDNALSSKYYDKLSDSEAIGYVKQCLSTLDATDNASYKVTGRSNGEIKVDRYVDYGNGPEYDSSYKVNEYTGAVLDMNSGQTMGAQ